MTEAGSLRHRIVFESPTASRNEFGENTPTWGAVATVWASIKPLSGRQLALAQADTVTASATHQIRVRYRAGLSKTFRIRYDGPDTQDPYIVSRYFQINAMLNEDETRRDLVITATEVPGVTQ